MKKKNATRTPWKKRTAELELELQTTRERHKSKVSELERELRIERQKVEQARDRGDNAWRRVGALLSTLEPTCIAYTERDVYGDSFDRAVSGFTALTFYQWSWQLTVQKPESFDFIVATHCRIQRVEIGIERVFSSDRGVAVCKLRGATAMPGVLVRIVLSIGDKRHVAPDALAALERNYS